MGTLVARSGILVAKVGTLVAPRETHWSQKWAHWRKFGHIGGHVKTINNLVCGQF